MPCDARERFPCGFCHQEAAQAHGQEEAPQAAQEDARPASQARQVGPPAIAWDGSCWSPGSPGTSGGASRALAAGDPSIDRVIGVDVVPPRGDIGDVSFVRADIRNPVIAKVIAKEDVDTVVHMSVIATPGSAGGRDDDEGAQRHRHHAAARCLPEGAPAVEHLVVKSTTTVYGASSRDPAMFTEDMGPKRLPRSGYAKDVYEVEGYVRGFARRRPDVRRRPCCAPPTSSARTSSSPMTSTSGCRSSRAVLGFDPRLQFLHEDDLIAVLRHAVITDVPGTFNVAGDGVLMLSQAVRRLGKPSRRRARASPSAASARCFAPGAASRTSRPSSSPS